MWAKSPSRLEMLVYLREIQLPEKNIANREINASTHITYK